MNVALVALTAAAALVVAASASNSTDRPVIPATPKMKTIGGQLVFNVGEANRVAIQYGEGAQDVVYLDDPSESTIDAIKLGYAIGAKLDTVSKEDSLETKLTARVDGLAKDLGGRIGALETALDGIQTALAGVATRLGQFEANNVPEWAAGISAAVTTLETEINDNVLKEVSTIKKSLSTTATDLKGEVASAVASLEGKVAAGAVKCEQPTLSDKQLAPKTCPTGAGATCSVACNTGLGYVAKSQTVQCKQDGQWYPKVDCALVIGKTKAAAGLTCRDIKAANTGSKSGTYWIHAHLHDPFPVYCDMSADAGGWTLIANVASNAHIDSHDGKVMPREGREMEKLSKNQLSGRDGWGDIGEVKTNAVFKAHHNTILKLWKKGPGHHGTNRWYLRKFDDPHCNSHPYNYNRFNVWRGIRDTWLWGSRGDTICGYDLGRNNYNPNTHRADNNGGRTGRAAMQWWEHHHVNGPPTGGNPDRQNMYVSRHGIPGDIFGGCEWLFRLNGNPSYGFCDQNSWSQLYLK